MSNTGDHTYRNDPVNCGHGGTNHVGGVSGVSKRCRLCGQLFDRLGRPVES